MENVQDMGPAGGRKTRLTARRVRPIAAILLAAAMLALPGTGASAQPTAAAPVPIESFFNRGSMLSAQLSPSGRWIAARMVTQGAGVSLAVIDAQDREPPKVVAAFDRTDVTRVRWLNDEILLFSLDARDERSGVQRFPGLMSVRRDGGGMRQLIKRSVDTLYPAAGIQPLEGNHDLLALGPPGSDELIVGEFVLAPGGQVASVKPLLLNARTGARRTLLKDGYPERTTQWLFDIAGQPRVAASSAEGRVRIHWLDPETSRWRQIAEHSELEPDFIPVHVNRKGELWVQVREGAEGSATLRPFDLKAGKPADDMLATTPGFDGTIGIITARGEEEILGYDVLTDAPQQLWTDPALKALQARVDAALPGRVNLLSCSPCKPLNQVLVRSYSDRSPGDWLLLKVPEGRWQKLGSVMPAITPSRMAAVEMHRVRARDGRDLPVWVTGAPAAGAAPKPAVVMVHGGPWVRGHDWAWEPAAQFLASRGYVVIEPEFRGSTGYGQAHFKAGWRQWGRAMQDDVSDALNHAVRQGWADGQRACLAGASYGGYATLMGLTRDDVPWRCGISWVAVTDPRLLFSIHWSDTGQEAKRYSMRDMIGDPQADAAMLAAVAPVELASRIKAPLILAFGRQDRRVPIEHGEAMKTALEKAGRPPQWVVYDDEGHGWRKERNQIDFWRRVEAFLAEHLKP